MQPADFGPDAAGRVVRAPEGYWTFLPAPLPPALEPSWDLFSRLSDADRALSELAGRAANLPNPHLLIAPFLRREAVLSSRIEGTQASISDLFFFEAGSPSARSATRRVPDDVQEVANYVRALEYGLKRTATLPISLRLIREIHGRLMKGVQGRSSHAGRVPAHAELDRPRRLHADGRHLRAAAGPGHASTRSTASRNILHQKPTLPPLVRLALVHYQFETIHPFVDGNGRVGRLLIPLLLCHEKLLPQPLLYLSAYFERHRAEYYRHLLTVSQTGSWVDWVVLLSHRRCGSGARCPRAECPPDRPARTAPPEARVGAIVGVAPEHR